MGGYSIIPNLSNSEDKSYRFEYVEDCQTLKVDCSDLRSYVMAPRAITLDNLFEGINYIVENDPYGSITTGVVIVCNISTYYSLDALFKSCGSYIVYIDTYSVDNEKLDRILSVNYNNMNILIYGCVSYNPEYLTIIPTYGGSKDETNETDKSSE